MRYSIAVIILLLSACDAPSQNLALGTLERERIVHTATANEIITSLPVLPGSLVTRGTLLVQLDNALQMAQVDKASAEMAQAEAKLIKLRNGARKEEVASAAAVVAGARATLAESQSSFERSLKLREEKLISQSELDKARAARDAGQAVLQNALEALQVLTNGTREEDLRAAEAALNATLATLASENRRLADLTITATRDGILDNLPWNLGERVTIGSPLAVVLAGNAPYARVYVPEPYRVKLNFGDALMVHVDGIEKPISGKLRWISMDPAFTPYYALNQAERSRLMYLAKVQLPDSEAGLPNGVPVQVELP